MNSLKHRFDVIPMAARDVGRIQGACAMSRNRQPGSQAIIDPNIGRRCIMLDPLLL